MAPDQQTPPTNPQPSPSVDDLISHANQEVYTFHASKEKSSLKSWLLGLPRTQKIIGIVGCASVIFIVLMVSLTLLMGQKGSVSSKLTQSGTTTASSKSIDSSNTPTTLVGDTNGDGVVDEYDTSDSSEDTTTISESDIPWWQQLLNSVRSKNSSTSNSSTSSNSSSSSTEDTSSSSSTSAVAVQENTEENQEEQQTSTAPVDTTPVTQTPATPTTGASTPAAAPTLNAVTNFRDAASTSSGLMKTGVLFRSAKLQNATTSDRAKLAALLKNGVIVDLRTASVRKSQPDKIVSAVTNLSFPVNAPDATKGDNRYVSEFVNNATDRGHFGDAITKIANAKGSVLVHCTAGKDRTGWMVAMVMYAIGANDKQVMDEYMRSKDFGATVDKVWLNNGIKAAKAQNGGSIMNYIKSTTKGLGVSTATIQKLKAKLNL